MSRWPLVTVPALTLGDLLLWHWSLAAHHEVLALASGLSLPALAIASVCLAAIAVVRLVARGVRVPLGLVSRARPGRASTAAVAELSALATTAAASTRPMAGRPAPRPATPRSPAARPTAPRPAQVPLTSADRERPPRKIAA